MDAPTGSDGRPTDRRSGEVIACSLVTMLISGVALGARFYARGRIMKMVGREDWTLLVSWLLTVAFTGVTLYECHVAKGHHKWTVSDENMRLYMRATWISTIFYQLSLGFSKISILFLYIRVLTYTYARVAAYFMLIVVVVYHIFGFASAMTLCRPLEAYWDRRITPESCHPESFMWAVIYLHILSDFFIFMIPMPVVFRMKLPRKQKAWLLLIFALGFFVCLISILRTVWIVQIFGHPDLTYEYVTITNWTAVELHSAILVACLIVLKPLVTKYWPRLVSSGSPANAGSSGRASRRVRVSFARQPPVGHDELYGSGTHIAMSSRSRSLEEGDDRSGPEVFPPSRNGDPEK